MFIMAAAAAVVVIFMKIAIAEGVQSVRYIHLSKMRYN